MKRKHNPVPAWLRDKRVLIGLGVFGVGLVGWAIWRMNQKKNQQENEAAQTLAHQQAQGTQSSRIVPFGQPAKPLVWES